MKNNENLKPKGEVPEETSISEQVSKQLQEMADREWTQREDAKKTEAGKLSGKQKEKTFVEKHLAEVQTREMPIRGAQNPELKRGEIFRFERGQILKGYKILRKQIREAEEHGEDTTSKKDLLKEMRVQAKVLEKNLDEIERQCYENIKVVDVETEFGKFSLPVVEFDLRKEDESEEDKRTPYFFIPGMPTSDFHSSVAISMGLALRGNKVYVPVDIETSSVQKPEDLKEQIKARGDFKIQAEVFKQTIRKLGLDKVNIIGHSFGATVALELGSDEDFEELEDLVVMDPLGIEEKGLPKLAKEFGFSQTVLRFLPYAEQRIKVAKEPKAKGKPEMGLYLEDVKIIAKKLYDAEKLSKIKPNGRFQVWFGTDSPIMNSDVIETAFKESDVEIYKVEGGEHMWPVRGALGLSRMLKAGKPAEQVTTVEVSDFEKSGMEAILENIK
ncbi:MAG: alpha/beta hydrolase [Candidatus Staskawiczbacteria bacterium]|nr:alpha/beta hydrolase [Candidatus Staskawiczbacteria bacterium]